MPNPNPTLTQPQSLPQLPATGIPARAQARKRRLPSPSSDDPSLPPPSHTVTATQSHTRPAMESAPTRTRLATARPAASRTRPTTATLTGTVTGTGTGMGTGIAKRTISPSLTLGVPRPRPPSASTTSSASVSASASVGQASMSLRSSTVKSGDVARSRLANRTASDPLQATYRTRPPLGNATNTNTNHARNDGPLDHGQTEERVTSMQIKEIVTSTMHDLLRSDQAALAQQSLHEQMVKAQAAEREARRMADLHEHELAQMRTQHQRQIDHLHTQAAIDLEKLKLELWNARQAHRDLERELESEMASHDAARSHVATLKAEITTHASSFLHVEQRASALKQESDQIEGRLRAEQQARNVAELACEQAQLKQAELQEKLRDAETIRRRLHNTIQELKGNIRVFVRVRPALPHEDGRADPGGDATGPALADITFPDNGKEAREIVLTQSGLNAEGLSRDVVTPFAFDRIFTPDKTQSDVFDEIEALAQSVLDGYNVCVFAYGQTGSGKSFTMEGGSNTDTRGMIPRAIEMIFQSTAALEEKGWSYELHGQFLEIYNETINDLLGTGTVDTIKHDIKHDKDGTTSVTNAVVLPLNRPEEVHSLLAKAKKRRAVAATLMNERSSRSHSVFSLRLTGRNAITNESCSGVLNLVDLAGSERLSSSGAGSDPTRLKETQAINKSLSALADVISSLGNPGSHVPYRNSKLTFLLQNSLNSNSKTLMFLNLSPMAKHLSESLCSLRFATKVNHTLIGTAKRTMKQDVR